ncbi:CinA family protein [Salinicola halophilus]|uniref:CinA family protein n=1 Tax=Salinicola halophilus TaxID=184065 RepID=UPI001EF8C6E3|nr:CinA family protein [Salinicola halophilus]
MPMPAAFVAPIDIDRTQDSLTRTLAERCLAAGVQITAAESCTGGGVASAITAVAGSSAYFETGYVTYANAAKTRLLGVRETTLATYGAVSERTVCEMVAGACRDSGAALGVAISGVAGPGGGSADKPVGTVWIAWGDDQAQCAHCYRFDGDRAAVREQAVMVALAGLVDWLAATPW